MQNLLKEQIQKSTKSKDDRSKEFETGIGSDDQKNIDNIYSQDQNQSHNQKEFNGTQQNELLKQNRTKTSSIHDSNKNNSNVLSNKKQYMESIRLSYLVLSNQNQTSPQKKKKKLKKKSFAVIEQEQENQFGDFKQSLKTPLKIDLKKLQQPKSKYIQLSQQLLVFNGKHWDKCHFDIDIKVQQLLVSNLHIPFSTITKIKIYKPDLQKKLRQIKITYDKINDEGFIFLNIKDNACIKKVPVNYLVFQQVVVHKLTFQNRFKETKWQKKHHICQQVVFGSYIFGQIYKKSQFFGKWQKRYIVLNGQGIFSYKAAGRKQDFTFFIQKQSIDYMWSRFQLVDNYLIIKVKHGMKQTQFGIPIANYSYPHYKNWLYYFFRLMTSN